MRGPTAFLVCALVLLTSSCGPLQAPLPVRLDDDSQNKVDQAWEKALAANPPVGNQALLDALLLSHAYQGGVDRLQFRSEKEFSGGLVIMEVEYDRRAPDKDRFDVQVVNKAGKALRVERYGRVQIDRTRRELEWEHRQLTTKKTEGNATPDELRRFQKLEDRVQAAYKLMPKLPAEDEAKGKAGE
jgi:hypothetical protein